MMNQRIKRDQVDGVVKTHDHLEPDAEGNLRTTAETLQLNRNVGGQLSQVVENFGGDLRVSTLHYNEAGDLTSVEATFRGVQTVTDFIRDAGGNLIEVNTAENPIP